MIPLSTTCATFVDDAKKWLRLQWKLAKFEKIMLDQAEQKINEIKTLVCGPPVTNNDCCGYINESLWANDTDNYYNLIDQKLGAAWVSLSFVDCGQNDWKCKAFDLIKLMLELEVLMDKFFEKVKNAQDLLKLLYEKHCNVVNAHEDDPDFEEVEIE